MEPTATACVWCGAGGDNGSAPSFVLPVAPSPAALAEAVAGPGGSVPPIAVTPLLTARNNLQGIAGWLILVAIGLGIGPLGLLLGLSASLVLLLSPESKMLIAAHPGISGVLLLNGALDAGFIAALIALNILFYGRKKTFPRWAMGFLVASLILNLAIHQMMVQYIPTYSSAEAFGSLVAAAIWIPYFLLSQRVKQTFVN